jgi:SAM-dependent methyltransferase
MCGADPEDQAFLGRRLDRRQGLWPKRKPGIATPIFRCRKCGLIYPNPMPIPESIGQHYEVEPEDYWHDAYFHVDPGYFRLQIEKFERLTGRSPHGRSALDVGAGVGKAMVALDRAGFETHGIEPSSTFRRAAIERMGIPEDRLQLASVEDANFPDDSFDFINFAAVLEHLADPAGALRKLIGWLKPEGVMYVEVPSSAFLLSRLVRLFYQLTGADYVINTCPMHMPYHLYEFGLKSFLRSGNHTGYSVVFHEYFPCAGYMPRVLIGPCNAVMQWTDTGMQLAVWLRKTYQPLDIVKVGS